MNSIILLSSIIIGNVYCLHSSFIEHDCFNVYFKTIENIILTNNNIKLILLGYFNLQNYLIFKMKKTNKNCLIHIAKVPLQEMLLSWNFNIYTYYHITNEIMEKIINFSNIFNCLFLCHLNVILRPLGTELPITLLQLEHQPGHRSVVFAVLSRRKYKITSKL